MTHNRISCRSSAAAYDQPVHAAFSLLATKPVRKCGVTACRILLIIAMLQFTVPAFAGAQDGRQADHEALRELKAVVVTALEQQDVKSLVSCLAKDFAFTTSTQDLLVNETELQQYLDRMFHGDNALISSFKTEPEADILTRFLSENVGVCYGTSKDTYIMKSGEIVQMNLRWTVTVVKEMGAWKVAAAHVGVDFLDNPVLAQVVKSLKKTALILGLAGMIAGVVAGWLIGRRHKKS